ncbi:MAG: twin-arginine translocase subunit TatC, partial [Planctomycetia bacterium]|nr:twin-arginine translocase subunit TatC [Planctomycetia bacterium]
MSPRGRKDDDLFSDSSMSFGEHLMELRRCLVIAIFWLVGGFVIALIPLGPYPSLSTQAVAYIQQPLKRALETFYVDQSTEKLSKQTKMLKEFGYSDQLANIPKKYNMTPRQFWVFPEDIDKAKALPNATILPGCPGLNTDLQTPAKPADSAAANASGQGSPAANGAATSDKVPTEASTQPASGTAVKPDVDSSKPVLVVLWEKLEDDQRTRTKALNMPETFVIFIKAAVIIGIVIGSPGIFYSFWSFVGAGLYAHEKRVVYRFLPLSLGLFIGGFCLAFFVVFQMVLAFLLKFKSGMNID